ncbi:MAG: PhoPQ-activated pathogenicity-related family protein [Gammaproteobacteria bacterium]|nr:PhoPQ-activated pathogenicity-related family protein [Gammaproteobacteria bacterium]
MIPHRFAIHFRLLFVLTATGIALAAAGQGYERTALDEYVATPDPNYKYTIVSEEALDGYTHVVVDMVSQKWLTKKEIDKPIWRHWLALSIPDEVTSNRGLLYIGGGSNGGGPPKPSPLTSYIAKTTKTVAAELHMIPNQPLVFAGDGKPRKEDAIIAYTWDKYMQTGDEKWPLRLPMTKAAVRAMDTITEVTAGLEGGGPTVDQFVVAGGSKRGWTTWTTAAVDKRVIAIVPLVIDMLNVSPSFSHHLQVYGKYARAVGDYEAEDVMSKDGTPEYTALMKIVEPYEYRHRLMLPKYIVNSAGDQFFLPDSWKFYWDGLIGEKWLRYVPNTDHGLGGSDVPQSVLAWYNSVVHNVARPRFSWKVEPDGTIRVYALDEPKAVKLWQATNPEERNFMKAVIGEAWSSERIEATEPGVYSVRLDPPEQGFTAYMLELTYDSGVPLAPFKFTTGIKVVPDIRPHEGIQYRGPKNNTDD